MPRRSHHGDRPVAERSWFPEPVYRLGAAAGALVLLAGLQLLWFVLRDGAGGERPVDAFQNYSRTDLLLTALAAVGLVAAVVRRGRVSSLLLLGAGGAAGAVVLRVIANDDPERGAYVALGGAAILAAVGAVDLTARFGPALVAASRMRPSVSRRSASVAAAVVAVGAAAAAIALLPLIEEGRLALAAAFVLFAGSYLPSGGARTALGLAVLIGLLVVMLGVPYDEPNPMGDYGNFIAGRDAFAQYAGESIPFQYHLGGTIVREADQALGADQASMAEAFEWLSRIVAILLVGGLVALATLESFSARVLRYLALVVALPIMVLFFGYHEYGHLPLALVATGLPLVMIGLERTQFGVVVSGAAVLGVGAALHGLGLVALGLMAFLLIAELLRNGRLRRQVGAFSLLARPAAAAITGWLVWVPTYFIVFNTGLTPGHADERPLRPLFEERLDDTYHRIVAPIFSKAGGEEIGMELLVLGAPVLLLLFLLPRDRLRGSLLVASIPVFLFTCFYWPVQGIGGDTDSFAMAFPAFFAAAWMVSRSPRLCLVALCLLLVGQVGMESVVNDQYWIHGQLP